MRRVTLFISLITVTVLLSCQKSDIEVASQDSIRVVQEFENADKSSKRVLFNILKPKERHLVWVRAFDKLIGTEEINAKQKLLLFEAKNSLTVDLYDETNSVLRETHLGAFTQQWIAKAGTEFNEEQLRSILSLPLSGFKSFNVVSIDGKGAKKAALGCDCHGGSSSDCNSTNGNLQCRESSCGDASSFGCGDWWLQPCDYVCYYNGKPYQL